LTQIVLNETLQCTNVRPGAWCSAQHLAKCEDVGGTIWVRRNRDHWVGRMRLPDSNTSIVSLPDFNDTLFADFFAYAQAGRIPAVGSVDAAEGRRGDFSALVAQIFVDAVEQDVVRRISRRYQERIERSQVLRGRPLWRFGRPIAGGLECRVHRLQVDNLLNRLILAGLRVAHRLLRTSKTSTLVYQFRSQVRDSHPRPADFDLARRGINALSLHYRPALELARSLVLQLDPDLFKSGPGKMIGFELYIPRLFESFVHRLVHDALPDFRVVSQTVDGEAFRDDWGNTYRTIRPDTVVYDADVPLAVLDAKYKPQYLRDRKKVSTADLYQLFFYQSRLRERSGLAAPPTAAIVAPSFGTSPPVRERIVHRDAEHQPAKICVVDLPLERVVDQLRYGEKAALKAAPELTTLLESVCEEWHRSSSPTKRNSVICRAV